MHGARGLPTATEFFYKLVRLNMRTFRLWCSFVAVSTCLVSGSVASACSRGPFSEVRFASLTYFIAVPLAQTIDAGPNRRGLQRPSRLRGQVVRLERAGGGNAEQLLRAARTRRNKVLLVPWNDAPDCSPVAWDYSGEPYWDPGRRGFFVALLRPEQEWVEHLPTFDVQPAFMEPYPYAWFFREGYHGTKLAGPSDLSVDQYWTLYEALPEYDELKKDPVTALRPINRWRETHPDWACRYPATMILPLIPWSRGNTPGPLPPEKLRPITPDN